MSIDPPVAISRDGALAILRGCDRKPRSCRRRTEAAKGVPAELTIRMRAAEAGRDFLGLVAPICGFPDPEASSIECGDP